MTDQAYKTDILIANDIDTYLKTHQNKSLLRFITCGSVDDGKSTLIGRLLYDSKMIFEDQLVQLKVDSRKIGTQGKEIDFALLVDGLDAEREQGITIDVAYRFFSTEKRKFIVADTPGHEQYTRNMVTGASSAQLAVILIDARKGVLTQTRRHSYVCHLLGIKNIILAVNKMDLVKFNKTTYDKIVSDYKNFATRVGIENFTAIPISGLNGDNIASRSSKTKWYNGSTLLTYLEDIEIFQNTENLDNFCMPVQWVNRPNQNFRGFSGTVVAGIVRAGDKVRILPSEKITHIDRIVTYDGDLDQAICDQSITLTLKDEVDCSRGQIIASASSPIQSADQFETILIWMDDKILIPGRSYYLKIGTETVSAFISNLKYKVNVNTMEKIASKTLNINDIGIANVTTDRSIPFIPYNENRTLGGFILIDKITNATVGAGLINFALHRSHNVHWQATEVSRNDRSKLKNQKPGVIWMTGLSGSGKSTIANALEKKLLQMNRHTFILDGDNVRQSLNKDLGFSNVDRVENIRRVGQVAKLMTDAGLLVIVALISPFRSEREMVRQMINPNEFIEVFIDTPLSIAEKRDVKGLYAKARSGQLKNFTGIDSPYEIPENPDIHIKTINQTIDEATKKILSKILN
ncbi:sulfate adenylyltransferase subunit CysN [Alphaproteobacteria bacterium]|nr:sulfate adenylyltransferase subunit CysN [Alphaproteobacteria bacterium]